MDRQPVQINNHNQLSRYISAGKQQSNAARTICNLRPEVRVAEVDRLYQSRVLLLCARGHHRTDTGGTGGAGRRRRAVGRLATQSASSSQCPRLGSRYPHVLHVILVLVQHLGVAVAVVAANVDKHLHVCVCECWRVGVSVDTCLCEARQSGWG
jgi:hypothetical protein